jgi:hypothetical protein
MGVAIAMGSLSWLLALGFRGYVFENNAGRYSLQI